MKELIKGKVIRGLGGLYEVQGEDGHLYTLRARGSLRRDDGKVLIGDLVEIDMAELGKGEMAISRILPRQNSLIRPPLANLDVLWLVMAAASPAPAADTTDKMLAICEHSGIEAHIIINKCDLSEQEADRWEKLYRNAGFPTHRVSTVQGEGVAAVRRSVEETLHTGRTGAFAGASGVGKSTLLNALFPELARQTGEVSAKTQRGKHTTRSVELFALPGGGYLADTPGFSLLDFVRFDFFALEDLVSCFRDFTPYLAGCRYGDCIHVREEECGVRRAVAQGLIASSRHESYAALYDVLKEKKNNYPKQ